MAHDDGKIKYLAQIPGRLRQIINNRRDMSLAGFLTLCISATLLIVVTILGVYAVKEVRQNKLDDRWAILFLEAERNGYRIGEQLQTGIEQTISNGQDPAIIFSLTGKDAGKVIAGKIQEALKPADVAAIDHLSVLNFAGVNYQAVIFTTNRDLQSELENGATIRTPTGVTETGRYLGLWPTQFSQWFHQQISRGENSTKIYLINKLGQLVYSNSEDITPLNATGRELAKNFVATPLQQGQFELQNEDGGYYGFFYEIPRSNLVIFTETNKATALRSISVLTKRFLVASITVLVLALILIQLPLNSVTQSLRELVQLTTAVAHGNFEVSPRLKGQGELALLGRSFGDMTTKLASRNATIENLMSEQRTKVKLESELSVAKSIQENLLPRELPAKESGLEISSYYKAAESVAGDWYNHIYDPQTGETIFIITDVSGHGAGSSLFTAMIAGIFEEVLTEMKLRTVKGRSSFQLDTFAERLNRVIRKIGRGDWHASMLIGRYRSSDHSLELLNAGHPFPLLRSAENGVTSTRVLRMPSDLIGLVETPQFAMMKTTLPKNASLITFTDGLSEGRSKDGRVFGQKRIIHAIERGQDTTVEAMVDRIYNDWNNYLSAAGATDDLCILALRAAA